MIKILIIEDDEPLLHDIATILRMNQYEVFTAINGLEGLKQARLHLPDLIISDIMMPVMDGYMVLLELRSDPATNAVPFIFLTARTQRPEIRRGMEMGADDYLPKPFTPDELLNSIQTRLDRRKISIRKYTATANSLRYTLPHALPSEIQIPLNGILNYARMLIEDYETADPKKIVQIAQGVDRAALRMHHLTENYLTYIQLEITLSNPARLDALRQQELDLPCETLKSAIIRKLKEWDRANDLVWECKNATVKIASDILGKIGEELVDNAAKFSQTGTPIEVRTTVQDNQYILQVTDHGQGMTAEQLSDQLPISPGNGLGLLILKRITEVYQGHLSIQSVPNQGTTVQVQLPCFK